MNNSGVIISVIKCSVSTKFSNYQYFCAITLMTSKIAYKGMLPCFFTIISVVRLLRSNDNEFIITTLV